MSFFTACFFHIKWCEKTLTAVTLLLTFVTSHCDLDLLPLNGLKMVGALTFVDTMTEVFFFFVTAALEVSSMVVQWLTLSPHNSNTNNGLMLSVWSLHVHPLPVCQLLESEGRRFDPNVHILDMAPSVSSVQALYGEGKNAV